MLFYVLDSQSEEEIFVVSLWVMSSSDAVASGLTTTWNNGGTLLSVGGENRRHILSSARRVWSLITVTNIWVEMLSSNLLLLLFMGDAVSRLCFTIAVVSMYILYKMALLGVFLLNGE